MIADIPLPDPDQPDFAPFWAGCREHRLLVPQCANGHLTWPPRPVCRACQAEITRWVEIGGRGRLYSWTVVHRTRLRGFADLTPYVVGIVALQDAAPIRIVARCELAFEQLVEGVALDLAYLDVDDKVTLPIWRVRDNGRARTD